MGYVSQTGTYPENEEVPIHVRWDTILEIIPEMAKRRLTDNLTDIYQKAYDDQAGVRLAAAYDLSIFATRYWALLLQHGRVLRPAAIVEIAHGLMWQRKLEHALEHSEQVRRVGDRIRKEKTNSVPKLTWIN